MSAKAKTESLTVARITELVQNYFRMREFKAESPHISLRKGFIEVRWAEEHATGQASFSQNKVTVSFSCQRDEWRTDEFKNLDPWKLWALDVDGLGFKVSVSYGHWDRGSNGWSTYLKYENGTLKKLVD